jgi:hypothetical protein
MRGQMVPPRAGRARVGSAELVRLVAFAALALFGAARWAALLSGGSHGRLIGLFGLALLLAVGRPLLASYSRLLAGVATALVLIAAFPVAGVPLTWLTHLRIAQTANVIGEGLSALPQVLVPYNGVNDWVRLDIVLGAGVLLFDAALVMAFAPRAMDDLRRAGVALPLVALAAVPSTLTHPRYPYLDGLALFLLLAAFVLGDRIASRQAGSAILICLATAIMAMLVAPGLDRHKPWLDYQALRAALLPKRSTRLTGRRPTARSTGRGAGGRCSRSERGAPSTGRPRISTCSTGASGRRESSPAKGTPRRHRAHPLPHGRRRSRSRFVT